MFSYILGELVDKNPHCAVLDVHGVGYELFISLATYQSLGELGQDCKLYAHHYVREDVQRLYGFATVEERQLFRSMIAISGVGPKVALAVLSTLSVTELRQVVLKSDIKALTRVPGIGKKMAERLMIDLKDKVDQFGLDDGVTVALPSAAGFLSGQENDVMLALISLGFKPAQAEKLIETVRAHHPLESMNFQDIMRQCLALV